MNNNTVFVAPMTSDECIHMCNSQKETDYLFYASLGVNVLLLITTSVSEIMSACKCKATGVFDGIVILARKVSGVKEKKKEEEFDSVNSNDLVIGVDNIGL